MYVAEIYNTTSPMLFERSSDRPSMMKLHAAGADDSPNFLHLLDAQRPGQADQNKPIMFDSGYEGQDLSLIDRLTAVRPRGSENKDELREAAEQLVSTTFIMPVFDKLRNDPLAANMFHGGQTETMFGRQLDQHLSDRIASGSSLDIVDAIYEQFSKYAGQTRQAAGQLTGPGILERKGVDIHG